MSMEVKPEDTPRVVLTRLTKRRLSTTSEDSKIEITETSNTIRRSTRRLSTTSEDTKVEDAPNIRKSTRRLSTASEDPITEETPSSVRKSTRRLSTASEDPIAEEAPCSVRKSTRRFSTTSEDPITEEVSNNLRRSSRSTSQLQRNVLEEKTATPKKRLTRRNSDISDPGIVSSPSIATRQLRSRKTFSDNDSVQPTSTPIKRRESRRLTNIIDEDENTLKTIEEKENIENHRLVSKPLEVIQENSRKSFSNMENVIVTNKLETNAQAESSTSPKKKSIDDKMTIEIMEPENSVEIKKNDKFEINCVTRSNTPKKKEEGDSSVATPEKGNSRQTMSNTPKFQKGVETSLISDKESGNETSKSEVNSETSPQKENLIFYESPKKERMQKSDSVALNEKLTDCNSPNKQTSPKTSPKVNGEQKLDASPIIGSGRKTRMSTSKLNDEKKSNETPRKEAVTGDQSDSSSINEDQNIKDSSQKESDRKIQTDSPAVNEKQKVLESPIMVSGRKTRSNVSIFTNEKESLDTSNKETGTGDQCSSLTNKKLKGTPQKECARITEPISPNIIEKNKISESPNMGSGRTTRSSISRLNNEEESTDSPKKEDICEEVKEENFSTVHKALITKDTSQKESKPETQPNTSLVNEEQKVEGSPKIESVRKTRSSISRISEGEISTTPTNETAKGKESSIITDDQKNKDTPQKETDRKTQPNTPTVKEEQIVEDSHKIESGRITRSSISRLNNEAIFDIPIKDEFQEEVKSSFPTVTENENIYDTSQKNIIHQFQSNTPTVNDKQKVAGSPNVESDCKTRSDILRLDEEEIVETTKDETLQEKSSNLITINEDYKIVDNSQKEIDCKIHGSSKMEIVRKTPSSFSKINNEEITDTLKNEIICEEQSNKSTVNKNHKIEDTPKKEIDLKMEPNAPAANEVQKVEGSQKEESIRKTRSSLLRFNKEEETNDNSKKETVKSETQKSAKEVETGNENKVAKDTSHYEISKKESMSIVHEEQTICDNPKKDSGPESQLNSVIDTSQEESGSKTQLSTSKSVEKQEVNKDTLTKEDCFEREVIGTSQKEIDQKIESNPLTITKSEFRDNPQKESDGKIQTSSLSVNEEQETVNTTQKGTNRKMVSNTFFINEKEAEATPQKASGRITRLSTMAINKEQEVIDTPIKDASSTIMEESKLIDSSNIKINNHDTSNGSVLVNERVLSPTVVRMVPRRSRKNSTLILTEMNIEDSTEEENPNLNKNILSPIKNTRSSNRNSPKLLDTPRSRTMELQKKQNDSILNIVSSTPTVFKGNFENENQNNDSSDSINHFSLKMSPEKSTDPSSPSKEYLESSTKQCQRNDSDLNVSDNVLELRKRSIIKSSPQKTPEKKEITEDDIENKKYVEEGANLLKSFVNLPKNSEAGDNKKVVDAPEENFSKHKNISQFSVKSKNTEEEATDAADESTDVEDSNENHLKCKKKLKRSCIANKNKNMEKMNKSKNSEELESTDDEGYHKNQTGNDKSKNVWKKNCKLAIQSDLPDSEEESSELSGYSDNNSSKKVRRKYKISDTSDSENDDKNEFIDNEAVECNDSRTPSPDENDIIEVGEWIESDLSDEGEESDEDYEKDSFVVSDELGDEADLLSGTGDDLSDGSQSDDSDLLLTQSKTSKQKFNKKSYKKSRIIHITDDESSDSISFKEKSLKVVNDNNITSSNEIIENSIENQPENDKNEDNPEENDKEVNIQQNNVSNESLEESSIEKLENSLNEINKLHTIIDNISEVISENISKKRRNSLSLSKISNDLSESINESSNAKKQKLNDTTETITETSVSPNKKLNKSLNLMANSEDTSEAVSKTNNSLNSSFVSDNTTKTISPSKKINNSINSFVISENISEVNTKTNTSPGKTNKNSSLRETIQKTVITPNKKLSKKNKSLNSSAIPDDEISEIIQETDILLHKNNKNLNSIVSDEKSETSQETDISTSKKLNKGKQSLSVFYDDVLENTQDIDNSPNTKLSLGDTPVDASEFTDSKKKNKLKNKQLNKSNISKGDLNLIFTGSSEVDTEKGNKLNNSNISEGDVNVIFSGLSDVDTKRGKKLNKSSAVSEERVNVSSGLSDNIKEKKLKNKKSNKSSISEVDKNVVSADKSEVDSKKAKKLKNKQLNKSNISEDINFVHLGEIFKTFDNLVSARSSEVNIKKEKKLKNKSNISEENVITSVDPSGEKSSKKKKLGNEKIESEGEENKNINKIKRKMASSSVEGEVQKKVSKKTEKLKEKIQSHKKWLDENFVALNVQLPSLLNSSFETSKKREETKKVKDNSKKRKMLTNNEFQPTKKKSKDSSKSVEGFEVVSLGQKVTPSKLGTTELNFKRQKLFGSNIPRQSSLDLINQNAKLATINRRLNK